MAKLMELNEKSQDSKFIASIAGNVLAPPVYAMTPVEGIVWIRDNGSAIPYRQLDRQNRPW